jgi:hypothetical protein
MAQKPERVRSGPKCWTETGSSLDNGLRRITVAKRRLCQAISPISPGLCTKSSENRSRISAQEYDHFSNSAQQSSHHLQTFFFRTASRVLLSPVISRVPCHSASVGSFSPSHIIPICSPSRKKLSHTLGCSCQPHIPGTS